MPKNTRYVGRPSVYGNPFRVKGGDMIYAFSVNRSMLDPWIVFEDITYSTEKMAFWAMMKLYRDWLRGKHNKQSHYLPPPPTQEQLEELKGKDLACWCNPSHICHVDVLLNHLEDEGI